MNVLLPSDYHFLQVGDQLYCRLLAPDFFDRYLDVFDEAIILARLAHADEPPPGDRPLDQSRLRIIGLPEFSGLSQFLKKRQEVKRIAAKALPEAEAIVFRAPGTIPTVVWSLLRQQPRPFGVECVGDPYDAFAPGALKHPLRPFLRWLTSRQLRKQCAEAYVASYVTAKALQRRYPPAPGHFTTNYSDIYLKHSAVLESKREPIPTTGPYRLINVGGFATMYKAHDTLIQAVARAVASGLDIRLTILGDGNYLPAMRELAGQLGIGDRVDFRGVIPPGEPVYAEFDRSHLFVMPSRQEGLPRAMVEAMARGLPVIGSTVGGIPELLRDEELVPPNDIHSLANKIQELLSDPARMQMLSKRNIAVASEYDENALRARRIEFYKHLREGTEAWLRNRSSNSRGSSTSTDIRMPVGQL